MRISDWSSDVCSSDLERRNFFDLRSIHHAASNRHRPAQDYGALRTHPDGENVSPYTFARLTPVPLSDGSDFDRRRYHELAADTGSGRRTFDHIRRGRGHAPRPKIGRAACRERVCQYVKISVVAVTLKKKWEQSRTLSLMHGRH